MTSVRMMEGRMETRARVNTYSWQRNGYVFVWTKPRVYCTNLEKVNFLLATGALSIL